MSARHTIPVDQVVRKAGIADRLQDATRPEVDRLELPYRDAGWIRGFVAAVVWGRR